MNYDQLIVVGAFVLVQLLLLGLAIDAVLIVILALVRWSGGES